MFKQFIKPTFFSLIFTFCFGYSFAQTAAQTASNYKSNSIIIKFRKNVNFTNYNELLAKLNVNEKLVSRIKPYVSPTLLWYNTNKTFLKTNNEIPENSIARIYYADILSGKNVSEVLEFLGKQDFIEYAEPNYKRELMYSPNDPKLGQQIYLSRIKALEAWDIQKGDSNVVVGLVDAGVDFNHEDFKNVFYTNKGETGKDASGRDKATNKIDDDGNGFVDDWQGYDFVGANGVTPDNNPVFDVSTHGVATSGLLAANANNGVGIAGVAYGCKILPVKVVDKDSDINWGLEGILYCAKMGARVVNYSIGGLGKSKAEEEIIDYVFNNLNCLVVASAGNVQGSVTQYDYVYPASYTNCLSVGACNDFDSPSEFSVNNYDIDLVAPGSFVLTTSPTNSYNYESGTSFSSPIVAASAALLLSQNKNYTAKQLTAMILNGCDDISSITPTYLKGKTGIGRLNIYNSLKNGLNTTFVGIRSFEFLNTKNNYLTQNTETTLNLGLHNYLREVSSVLVKVECESNPEIIINNNNFIKNNVAENQTFYSNPNFVFTIPNSVKNGSEIVFKVTIITPQDTVYAYLHEIVSVNYATLRNNNVQLCFTNIGNLAYSNFGYIGGEGVGHYEFSGNSVYHAGLMIATDENKFSDVVRRGYQTEGIEQDFEPLENVALIKSGNRETGIAKFNDNGAIDEKRLGVEVKEEVFTYENEGLDDVAFLTYQISNKSANPLNNLYCGLYIDWDLGIAYNNSCDYDAANKIGYVRNTVNKEYYAGHILLSNQKLSFRGIVNSDPATGVKPFPESRKWAYLTGGVDNAATDQADVSCVIGAGGNVLLPNKTENFAFAIIFAKSPDSLVALAKRAREKYNLITGINNDKEFDNQKFDNQEFEIQENVGGIFDKLRVTPKGEKLSFEISSTKNCKAKFSIYNLRAEEIMSFDKEFNTGLNKFDVTLQQSGVYFYQIRVGDKAVMKKVILSK